jgi:trigger factor
MQISSQELEGFTQSVSFQFDASEMDKKFQFELKKIQRTARISGFRKGKVPMTVIRQRYGAGVINEMQSDALQQSWRHLINELKLIPLTQPEVDVSQPLRPSKGLSLTFSFEIIPPFDLPQASELEGELIKWTVSDARVDQEVERLCKLHGDWIPLKRRKKCRNGDQVKVSLTGFDGEEELSALKSDEQTFELGSQQIIPELEKKIMGLKESETFTLDYTFPEEHHNPELAGRAVRFEGTLTSICEQVVLSTEELIEKLPNDEDEAALRERLSQELVAEAESKTKAELRDSVAKQLREMSTFFVFPSVVDEQAHARLHHHHDHGEDGSCDHEHSDEELSEARVEAERDLRFEAIIREYSESNGITVTEADFTTRLLEMLRSSGEFGMQLLQFYQQPANRKRLEASILDDKVIDSFIEAANFAEVERELELPEE